MTLIWVTRAGANSPPHTDTHTHGAGTHSIEGEKWQENAEHIAQDIWVCSAFMLSKWDSYCRVDLGSPSQNFFRAPPARSAGKPMEHSYRYWLRFGTRSGCQNFRASFQGFLKTSKRRTEAYRMHAGTDFLKLPPVTGQYWSLFQCSMLGTGGTCDTHTHTHTQECVQNGKRY